LGLQAAQEHILAQEVVEVVDLFQEAIRILDLIGVLTEALEVLEVQEELQVLLQAVETATEVTALEALAVAQCLVTQTSLG
jgi:superfamily II RNA helicase